MSSRSFIRSATVHRTTIPGSLFLFLLLFTSNSRGQYRFDLWTADDGLPQNSVNDIIQTRDSYIWLATYGGLVRFDGVHFTVFDRANSPGLISNRLTVLYQDRSGDLWIGADDAGLTRLHNGVFTSFGTESGLFSGWVRGITSDPSGDLLVLLKPGVTRLRTGRFERVNTGAFPNNRMVDSRIIKYREPAGFWSWSPDRLATIIHGRLTVWDRGHGLPEREIRALAEDEHGTIWAGGNGILLHDKNGNLAPAPLPSGCLLSEDVGFLPAPKLKLVCRSSKPTVIISALDGSEREVILNLPFSASERLSHMVFYQDREGLLWVGADGGGLCRLRQQAIIPFSEQQGLRGHNIYPILRDHSGAIWIAAWPNTLNCLVNGKLRYFTERDGLLPRISALFQDRQGRLWVGAYADDGLRVLEKGRFVPPRGLRNLGVVRAILEDRSGAVWFGGEEKLVRYDGHTATTFTVRDGLATNYTNVLAEDNTGNLWIGGFGGLTRFSQGRFTAYTVRDGLPSATVRALYVDAENVLWIGTYDGGLGRLRNGKFTRYTIRDGLYSNGAFQILEDSRGYFWISSNQGIYRVKKQDLNDFADGKMSSLNSIGYAKSDGMLNAECNGGHWPAGIRARDGTLWFPTQNGIAIVDPAHVPTNTNPPPVVIESLLADRRPEHVDRAVTLKPTQNTFEIKYTALSFAAPEGIRFKYKLEGIDQDWVDAGSRRTAYYSKVPHGRYLFRVIAANSDAVWNLAGRSLEIAVLPYFYQTWWFSFLAIVTLIAFGYLGWRKRMSRLERAFVAQQAFSRQLIASQESERKRIAAELHDTIGQRLAIIKNLTALYMSNGTVGNGLAQLDEISCEVSQAIGDVREISYNLRPYQLDRLGLTKALEAMLKKASSASGITFSVFLDDINDMLSDQSAISCYRIVQEAVSNILKHSCATQADVMIRRHNQKVLLRIHDNGKGFSHAAETGDPRAGGSGLRGISERAQLLGGHLECDSAPGRGTTLSIEFSLTSLKHEH